MKPAVAILAAALILGACGEDGSDDAFPEACMLPSPKPSVDLTLVKDEFVLPGSVVRQVSNKEGLLVIALNVPFGVTDSLKRYKEQLDPPEYEVISEDNEGFEAELFLRNSKKGNLLAVQIRRPQCVEASAVFVQVDNRER